ncbi:hydrogenase maturation protease [Thiocapsa rosea]|uniref:Hydrogenase maturation protease n=1 Tax=Thiocapsa rosea TaxID=69360 RepID=A0A495VC35_9GAMM|nr:hydrogenase maturation protease [Thiocapsa rosea]RKT45378.1 hydrogenase maturation protease [Thiocapsa rosea]
MTTLILALGNPLRGDDGVGAAVLDALPALPAGVTGLDGGTPGLGLVLSLQGYDRVIIVDAAEMGEAPGTWRRFTPDCLRTPNSDLRGTLHDAGLAEALVLGEALGVLPSEIIIFGIQPEEIGWAPGLTRAVAAAIPGLCEAITGLVALQPRQAAGDGYLKASMPAPKLT